MTLVPRPEDEIPFRTRVDDVRIDSPFVVLDDDWEVPALPLADGTAPTLPNGMFLRASLAREDVAPALALFDLVPITPEDFRRMCAIGLWTPARPLTATQYGLDHMTSLGFSLRHDESWWSDIELLHVRNGGVVSWRELQAWVDALALPILCAKEHAAGPDGRVDRMVGGDRTDNHRPDLIQSGTGPNHVGDRLVHDYWTKTRGKRKRR